MSVTSQVSAKPRFSIANHLGHGLGVLISAGNVLVGLSPGAREGDGYSGNVWIAMVVFGAIGLVALLASWITRASAPRRIGGVALVLVGESRDPVRPRHQCCRSHRQLCRCTAAVRCSGTDPPAFAQGQLVGRPLGPPHHGRLRGSTPPATCCTRARCAREPAGSTAQGAGVKALRRRSRVRQLLVEAKASMPAVPP
jgi:hypothetical protein